MLNILMTRSMLEGDIRYIKNGLDKTVKGKYEIIAPDEWSEDGICRYAENADVLLGPFVTSKIIEKAKNLKLIQIPWTGMDTFDFSAVKNCAVPVCNTHSNADSVAELGVTLALDLLKKVSYHDRKMRGGNWNRDQKPLDLKSRMLSKQKVCILGCGNIGSRIARIVSAFGAEVSVVDDRAKENTFVSRVYSNTQLKEAFSDSDLVICTIPLTSDTRETINADILSAAKAGMLLVNMSRAAVMDEDAVYAAFQNGALSGFASDVWWNTPKRGESESYPSTHNRFWELDNVVMSPHRAGFVADSLPHLDGAIENITALIQGQPLKCIVDVNKGF